MAEIEVRRSKDECTTRSIEGMDQIDVPDIVMMEHATVTPQSANTPSRIENWWRARRAATWRASTKASTKKTPAPTPAIQLSAPADGNFFRYSTLNPDMVSVPPCVEMKGQAFESRGQF